MVNPWKKINLSDYENHMSLVSVKQLQALNLIMKDQLSDYDVHTVMIMGIAGGNGLEHITNEKYQKVYGIDINEDFLKAVAERYKSLSDVLECLNIDIVTETDKLPEAELLIANLLVEYVGYEAFSEALEKVKPDYVSCVVQINEDVTQWVSNSPYIHAFDELDSVHHQMEENELTLVMNETGYRLINKSKTALPNGKSFVRLDYKLLNGA